MYVKDISAYHFVKNPFQENTYICKSGADNYYICNAPVDNEHWDEQLILRKATDKEKMHHNDIIFKMLIDERNEY